MATRYLTLPSGVKIRSFVTGMLDGLSQNRGPYSGAERRLETGGEIWVAALELAPMRPEVAQEFQAISRDLMRADAALRLGAPSFAQKRGTASGAALRLDGSAAAGATDIDVYNMGAGKTLLAGSYITIDARRLHQVVDDATADGAGKAMLTILPRLRESYISSTRVRVNPPDLLSMWRLNASPTLEFQAPVFTAPRIDLFEAIED